MESGARTHRLRGFGPFVPMIAVLVAAVLVGVGIGVGVHYLRSRTAPTVVRSRNGLDGQATWAAAVRPAPPITTLRDQTGARFSLGSLRGQTVEIVFFDSHCKAACPLEGRDLAAAEQALPAAQRPVLVAVSVNALDTSASTRTAVRAWGLSRVAPWHWLMGRRAQLAPVWRAYHIYVGPSVNGDVAHTEAVYLVDRRGYERSAYMYPFLGRFVTHDLRALAGARRG
jgi:cytochrome oxidase Cu insertion factor (SCO1/SenC/PrrC family)